MHLFSERGSQAAGPGPGRGVLKPCVEGTVQPSHGDEKEANSHTHSILRRSMTGQTVNRGIDLSKQLRNKKDPKQTSK